MKRLYDQPNYTAASGGTPYIILHQKMAFGTFSRYIRSIYRKLAARSS